MTDLSGTTNRLKIDQHFLLTNVIFECFLFVCCMPLASLGPMFCAMGCVCVYVRKNSAGTSCLTLLRTKRKCISLSIKKSPNTKAAQPCSLWKTLVLG